MTLHTENAGVAAAGVAVEPSAVALPFDPGAAWGAFAVGVGVSGLVLSGAWTRCIITPNLWMSTTSIQQNNAIQGSRLTGPKIIAVHKLKNAGMSIGREALLSDMIATTACWEFRRQLEYWWKTVDISRSNSRLTAENIQLSDATIIPIVQNDILANPEGVRVASIWLTNNNRMVKQAKEAYVASVVCISFEAERSLRKEAGLTSDGLSPKLLSSVDEEN
jgi:hypothetical protein